MRRNLPTGRCKVCFRRVVAAAALAGLWAAPAAAEWEWGVFPQGKLYPESRADPQHPGFGLVLLGVPDASIPDAGDYRVGLSLGGRFPVLRLGPADHPWHLELSAGFHGQFDTEHSLDNSGWDGIYGLALTTRLDSGVAMKAGIHHISSHVGDEYAERTGRRRIGYTREELVVGLSVPLGRGWRVYGEGGWGYAQGNRELQEPGRGQLGVELERPGSLGRAGRHGWYVSFDAGAWEERDWDPTLSLQGGLLIPSGDRLWRVGIGAADGRVPIGEFFFHDELRVQMGLWLDL